MERNTHRPGRHRNAITSRSIGMAIALALLPCSAWAQAHMHSAIADFREIDTDRDAKLDRRELAAAASLDFQRLDRDGDGYLTRAELKRTRSTALLLPMPGRLNAAAAFAAADTDHDRKIDKHEYVAAVISAYMSCDRNQDGTIELSDLRHCQM